MVIGADMVKELIGMRCKVHIVNTKGDDLFYEGEIIGVIDLHILFKDKLGVRRMFPMHRVESVQEVKRGGLIGRG